MSVEQAKAFIERMKSDEAFREKVLAIEDAAGRLACIRGEGFECSLEEINEMDESFTGVEAGLAGCAAKGLPYIDRQLCSGVGVGYISCIGGYNCPPNPLMGLPVSPG